MGIGSGSVCTTRIQTGVGMPQLSAIAECSDAAHGINGMIISDGGITCPGDVAKAFGGGADFRNAWLYASWSLMNQEAIWLKKMESNYKIFYGMSSVYCNE